MFDPHNETNDPKLEALIERAQRSQVGADGAVDWSAEIRLPDGVNTATYADLVSQLYYAEEATIAAIGRLLLDVPDFQAKRYLCTQAADEARHAQAYRRYLERVGDIAPINEGLQALLQEGLAAGASFRHRIIALNVVMETEALKQQKKRIESLPCPLFGEINRAIIVDEARHAAFGKIYMKTKVAELGAEERAEVVAWIGRLWQLWEAANRGRYDDSALPALQTSPEELGQRRGEIVGSLREVGLL